MAVSYFAKERFIHQDLVREARQGLASLYTSWTARASITPFVLVWPASPVVFHGRRTEGIIPVDLPPEKAAWPNELKRIVKVYGAYALLLVEQHVQEVVVILESPHGTVSWHVPIRNQGNVRVLDDAEEKTDVDYIGLLWSPMRGSA